MGNEGACEGVCVKGEVHWGRSRWGREVRGVMGVGHEIYVRNRCRWCDKGV